jgi:hypothetical protein
MHDLDRMILERHSIRKFLPLAWPSAILTRLPNQEIEDRARGREKSVVFLDH